MASSNKKTTANKPVEELRLGAIKARHLAERIQEWDALQRLDHASLQGRRGMENLRLLRAQ